MTLATFVNNTNWNLYVKNNHVYTDTFIQAHSYIGAIIGKHFYTCEEMIDPKYLIVLDDWLAIDCSDTPRCILSMASRISDFELAQFHNHNCKICYSYNDNEDSVDVYVIATKNIYPNEELIIKQSLFEN
jgi:hypothetical protein